MFDFMQESKAGICDVCSKQSDVIIRESPFAPASFAYCEQCYRAGREPYDALVVYFGLAGMYPQDFDSATRVVILQQLLKHGVQEEEFLEDANAVRQNYLAKLYNRGKWAQGRLSSHFCEKNNTKNCKQSEMSDNSSYKSIER